MADGRLSETFDATLDESRRRQRGETEAEAELELHAFFVFNVASVFARAE